MLPTMSDADIAYAESAEGREAADTRWHKGQSGNPSGRPKGARNRKTVEMGMKLAERYEELARQIGESALAGDVGAAKIALELIEAAGEHETCRDIGTETISSKKDLARIAARLTSAALNGDLRAGTAQRLMEVLGKAQPLLPKKSGGEDE